MSMFTLSSQFISDIYYFNEYITLIHFSLLHLSLIPPLLAVSGLCYYRTFYHDLTMSTLSFFSNCTLIMAVKQAVLLVRSQVRLVVHQVTHWCKSGCISWCDSWPFGFSRWWFGWRLIWRFDRRCGWRYGRL
jgi:hypothetical protein